MKARPPARAFCDIRAERGQTNVEYALVMALVAVAAIAFILGDLGPATADVFSAIGDKLGSIVS